MHRSTPAHAAKGRMDTSAALPFAVDGATAAAAAFNAAWLFQHWVRGAEPARRLAAATLATMNAGIAVQAAFAQALFTAHRLGWPTDPFFAAAPWLASRVAAARGHAAPLDADPQEGRDDTRTARTPPLGPLAVAIRRKPTGNSPRSCSSMLSPPRRQHAAARHHR